MSSYNKLVEQYLNEHPNAKRHTEQVTHSMLDPKQFNSDSVLEYIKDNCKLLIDHGFTNTAKNHLVDYVSRKYPERLAEELVWFEGLLR